MRQFSSIVSSSSTIENASKFQYQPNHVEEIQRLLGCEKIKTIPRRQVFSGIQPTGNVHLGNYLGALANWKIIQDIEFANLHLNLFKYIISSYTYHSKAAELVGKSSTEIIQQGIDGIIYDLKHTISQDGDSSTRFQDSNLLYSIVDLHAVSIPRPPSELHTNSEDLMRLLLSIGLTSDKSSVFFQSDCHHHSELNWLLTSLTPVTWLYNMTQFKEKALKVRATSTRSTISDIVNDSIDDLELLEGVNLGLLTYPILMASDILVYNTTHVPAGHDQLQHIALTRDIAQEFNRRYSTFAESSTTLQNTTTTSMSTPFMFDLPEAVLNEGARIMSLRVPESKMSKSDPASTSRIHLTDTDDEIRYKIRNATIDSISMNNSLSYNIENHPGISNLIDIAVATENNATKRRHIDQTLSSIFTHTMYHHLKSEKPLEKLIIELQTNPKQTLEDTFSYIERLEVLLDENYAGRTSQDDIIQQCNYESKNGRNSTDGINSSLENLYRLVTEKLITEISPIRAEYQRIEMDDEYVITTAKLGAEKARSIADKNLTQIYKTMGYTASRRNIRM